MTRSFKCGQDELFCIYMTGSMTVWEITVAVKDVQEEANVHYRLRKMLPTVD